MSAERRKIEPSEIRKGDLIRVEQRGYDEAEHSLSAAESIAKRDGEVPSFLVWGDSDVYLLDRPVPLPTRLFSLVVPPAGQRATEQAFVLEPNLAGSIWLREGRTVRKGDVMDALREGWVAIEGPEVLS